MLNKHIPGAVRSVGKSQGYIPISVRYDNQDGYPIVTTAWEPTPEEIAAIVAGGSIFIAIIAEKQPPLQLWIGEPPQ